MIEGAMNPMDSIKPTAEMHDQRAPPKDLSHHLSRSTVARQASSVKMFYKYFARECLQKAGATKVLC